MSIVENATHALPLWLVTDGQLATWLAEAPPVAANWARANGFQAEKNRVLMLPGPEGPPPALSSVSGRSAH